MRLSIGTKIIDEDGNTFELVGTRKLQGQHLYVFADPGGKKGTVRRESLIEAVAAKRVAIVAQ
jgi:hypothetical protein